MIDLPPEWLETVKAACGRHLPGRRVLVFGSRVNGTAKRHSDLDLLVGTDGVVEFASIAALREALEESSLPIRVDVVDANEAAADFVEAVLSGAVPLTSSA